MPSTSRIGGTVEDLGTRPEAGTDAGEATPERRLRFTLRALAALRACTALLVEPTSEAELLARLCPAVLAAGAFELAWIGVAEDDPARTVRPIASAGATAYLDGLLVSWADDAWGRGPTGTAIRTGEPRVVHQVALDPGYAPWRATASRHGFASSVAIPFALGTNRAVLNLYDAEPAAFGPEETAVLRELVQMLAYGVAARRTEARLLEARRIARVGWWEWDVACDAAACTDEVYRMFGLDPADHPPGVRPFVDALAPEDRPRAIAAVERALAGEAPYDVHQQVVLPDGARRILRVRAEITRDAAGRPRRMVGTTQDVTATARLQTELAHARELDRLKAAFLADVTHELRSPLTALLGFVELLEETCDPDDPHTRSLFEVAHRQLRRLRRLVEDLLDASSMEAGTFQLRPAWADLAAIAEGAVATYRAPAAAVGITLALRLGSDLPPLRLDAQRIDQVLTNLIDNAIKFTPPGGHVAVGVQPEPGAIRVEVRDSGPGIAAPDLPRVFQRFARLPGGRRARGTGLGLAIAKALVEAHGGAIQVESEPGHGTTFAFTLPAGRS